MTDVVTTGSNTAARTQRRWWHRSEVALPALTRRVVVLRIGFGVVWAIDAYLKWQPSDRKSVV